MNLLQKNIPNIIYGGTDGIITTFGIIVGTIGAKQNMVVAFILAVANLLADAFSMGVGSYESVIIEKYQYHAIAKGMATFIAFVLIGSIPILCFLGTLGKKRNEFSSNNITTLIILTLVSFIIVGLIKANYESLVGDSSNKKSKKEKFKIVSLTVLRGAVAGLIAYLVAHNLTNFLEN